MQLDLVLELRKKRTKFGGKANTFDLNLASNQLELCD